MAASGDLRTSGGVACGIDLALHLAEAIRGPGARDAVARGIGWVLPSR